MTSLLSTPNASPLFSLLLLLLLLFNLCTLRTASAAAASSPKQCRPGRYLSASAVCTPCQPGSYSWGGNFRSCLPCPAGTYTPYKRVVDGALCLPCPSGTVSAAGAAKCVPKYRRTAGMVSASTTSSTAPPPKRNGGNQNGKKCGPFWISPPEGVSYLPPSVCVSPITGCPKGSWLFKWTRRALCRSAKTKKILCGPGAVFDGVDRCLSCVTGSILVRTAEKRRFKCERCGGNSVSKGGVQRTCVKCECGYARSLQGDECIRVVPEGVTLRC